MIFPRVGSYRFVSDVGFRVLLTFKGLNLTRARVFLLFVLPGGYRTVVRRKIRTKLLLFVREAGATNRIPQVQGNNRIKHGTKRPGER